MSWMKIPLEGRLAADRFGFGIRNHRPFVDAMRNVVQPEAVAAAKVHLQESNVRLRQICDRNNAKCRELLVCFRTDSIDFPGRKGPDTATDICRAHYGEAIRLFEV